jgi:hypothetical protein
VFAVTAYPCHSSCSTCSNKLHIQAAVQAGLPSSSSLIIALHFGCADHLPVTSYYHYMHGCNTEAVTLLHWYQLLEFSLCCAPLAQQLSCDPRELWYLLLLTEMQSSLPLLIDATHEDSNTPSDQTAVCPSAQHYQA